MGAEFLNNLGVAQKASEGDFAGLSQLLQKREQLAQNKLLGQQILQTPDFNNIGPEYQQVVKSYATRGDLDNAQQYINAGRLANERKEKAKEKAEAIKVTSGLVETGSVSPEFAPTLKHLAATGQLGQAVQLLKSGRAEEQQSLRASAQAKSSEEASIRESGLAQEPKRLEMISNRISAAQKSGLVQPQDFDINYKSKKQVQRLANKLLLKPEEVSFFLQAAEEKGKQFSKGGFLGFGAGPGDDPTQVSQELLQGLPPEQLQARQRELQLRQEQQGIQEQLAGKNLVSKGAGKAKADPNEKVTIIRDGRRGTISRKFLKPTDKLVQ